MVLTNQMTTKIYSERHKSSHLIPALGESWAHSPTHRLLLHWRKKGGIGATNPTTTTTSNPLRSSRLATIFKSPSQPERTVPFQVTSGGIRDAATDEAWTTWKDVARMEAEFAAEFAAEERKSREQQQHQQQQQPQPLPDSSGLIHFISQYP